MAARDARQEQEQTFPTHGCAMSALRGGAIGRSLASVSSIRLRQERKGRLLLHSNMLNIGVDC